MGLTLLDYTRKRQASAPASATDATLLLTFGSVPATRVWRVEGIVVACNSTATPAVYVYDATPSAGLLPCQGTRYGTFTVDDQASPITLRAGDQLVIEFRGCSLGSVARARVQFAVYAGTVGSPTPVAV